MEYEKIANDEIEKQKREKEEQNKKREEVGLGIRLGTYV